MSKLDDYIAEILERIEEVLVDPVHIKLVQALPKSQPERDEAEKGIDFERDKALALEICRSARLPILRSEIAVDSSRVLNRRDNRSRHICQEKGPKRNSGKGRA